MAAGWDADATKALISIWGQENVQTQLDSVSRNRKTYEKIALRLEVEGYARTWNQCRTKIKNLTQKNRKVRYTKASKLLFCVCSYNLHKDIGKDR